MISVSVTNCISHSHRPRPLLQAFAANTSTIILRTICVMSVLLLHQHTCSSRGESPMIGATQFDYNATYRTNVCDRQRKLFGHGLELRDALQGLDLSVYITDNSNTPLDFLFQLSQEGTIPENEFAGINANILDELAKRGGFTWRNRFGTGKGRNEAEDGNKTYGDLLIWSTDTYDISADYWNQSNERKAQGIHFPYPWNEDSIILVSKMKKKMEFGSFLKPFQWMVWTAIGISIFATGILYNFLQILEGNADERRPDAPTSVFLSALMFTGHFSFQPNTHAARLLSCSWSFWALITVSAYTANMASFLLTRDVPSFAVSSLEDVIRLDKSVCLLGKSNHDDYMSRKHPSFTNIIRTNYESETFDGLLREDCDVALAGTDAFNVFQRQEIPIDGTPDDRCKLVWVGRSLEITPSGFATTIDTGTFCTSLISYVLDLHMHEMKEDGFLGETREKFYEKLGPNQCVDTGTDQNSSEEDPDPLGMNDMFGIFSFHALCSVISVLLAFGLSLRKDLMERTESMRRLNIAVAEVTETRTSFIWEPRQPIAAGRPVPLSEPSSIWTPRRPIAADRRASGAGATSNLRNRTHRTTSPSKGQRGRSISWKA